MPQTPPELIGRPGIEFNDDLIIAVPAHDGETAAQILRHAKLLWLLKCSTRHGAPIDAAKGERANPAAVNIVPDQIPAIIIAGQVIRMNMATNGIFFAGLAIQE